MNREQRKACWEAIRDELREEGYFAPPIFLSKWMRYRLIVVAVNHLAAALERDPFRVYQALLCRAERTRLGRPYTPYKQARPTQGGRLEGERRVAVVCPHCLKNLLDAGPETEEEVKAVFRLNAATDFSTNGEE